MTRKGKIRVEREERLETASRDGVRTLIVRAGDFFGPRTGNSWFAQGLIKPGANDAPLGGRHRGQRAQVRCGDAPLHEEEIERGRLPARADREDHVRLPAMMGLVVEQMSENFTAPLLKALPRGRRVGEQPLESGIVEPVD